MNPHHRMAIPIFRLLAALAALAACAAVAAVAVGPVLATPAYPLKQSANRRYLVDQNNIPTMIMGDSPQALVVNTTPAEAEMFFANRSAHGFNSLWVNLLCATNTGGRPDGGCLDGTLPFTQAFPSGRWNLDTPNEAYFAKVDSALHGAAAHGIQIILDPIETRSWLDTMRENGPARCRNYGRYLGQRYAGFDNIIWMSGNDFQGWADPANDEVVLAVAHGILDNDQRHIHTLELNYLASSSLDDSRWNGILGLNATYTYYPTYARLRDDYNRPSFLPNFMVEANYEFESLQGPVTTAPILRKQEYWTMTSGAAGQLYGNGYTWPFAGGWQDHLDTPGAEQIAYLNALFIPRPWYELVPDTSHVVVTSGYGVYADNGYVADNDFLTAARTPDGSLVIIYTPIVRTFTVDMAQLAAAATTRWYDPSSGVYLTVAGSPFPNAGHRQFTPPGLNHDGDGGWVLALETVPVETEPPVVTLATPSEGSIVSGVVQVTALAGDDVGVAGVQFKVDGANIAPEVRVPPYVVSWNSRSVANGSHVVSATARDVAGNRATDSAVVTVDNPVLPPPTDHLALAYAFDESVGGSTADRSGHDNTGFLHGAFFAGGKNGNGLHFDGQNDYAETPNSSSIDIGGTGLTILFWVWIETAPTGVDYLIAGKPWYGSAMAYPFYQYGVEYSNGSPGTLDFYFGSAGGAGHGPYRMGAATGGWVHVAYTYDGQTVRGYLNGVETLTVPEQSSIQTRGQSLRLGADGAYQQFLKGRLDDLRIYSRALTVWEVQAAMWTPVRSGGSAAATATIGGEEIRLTVVSMTGVPFTAPFRIDFDLPQAGRVELAIFSPDGRLVRPLGSEWMPTGPHRLEWDGMDGAGRRAAAGRYYVRLDAGRSIKSVPLTLLR